LVGVDDEVNASPDSVGKPSVEFVVIGDGKTLWQSGVIRANELARPVDVDLRGVDGLKLKVALGGNNNHYDQADWVDARIEVIGNAPYARVPNRT